MIYWLIFETIYVLYMLVFFKTCFSFHLPIEKLIQKSLSIHQFIIHPIDTGVYENKVCGLGHLFAYMLVIWNIVRNRYPKKYKLFNSIIWLTVFLLSILMNPNVTLYLLPIFIGEIFFYICNR